MNFDKIKRILPLLPCLHTDLRSRQPIVSGPLFTLCSQAEYRIQRLSQDTTPGAELTRLGYPYQTSGSTECARAIVASNYEGGGPQVSEHLSIQGRVEIEGLCGGVGREQSVVQRFSLVVRSKPWSAEQQGRGDNLRYQSWGVPSRYLHNLYTTEFKSCAYDYLGTFPSDDEVMYNYGAR